MVRMNFIFIFISSSDTNLLRKKICKTKNKKTMALPLINVPERNKTCRVHLLAISSSSSKIATGKEHYDTLSDGAITFALIQVSKISFALIIHHLVRH